MTKIALIHDICRLAEDLDIAFREKPGFEVVYRSHTIESLLEGELKLGPPNLILLVVSAKEGEDLIRSLPEIRATFPNTMVMVAATSSAPNWILEAVCQGADSYIVLDKLPQDLWKAIETTLAGRSYIDPHAASVLVNHLRHISPWRADPTKLSIETWRKSGKFVPRELQIIQGLVNNQSYKEIAHDNNIGLNTVRHYVKSVYRKLNINTKNQLKEALAASAWG
jgi:DNA-binding NarL/FixJ family response regulator